MPIRYYENNLISTFVLLRLMDEFKCRSIVFSSSATGETSPHYWVIPRKAIPFASMGSQRELRSYTHPNSCIFLLFSPSCTAFVRYLPRPALTGAVYGAAEKMPITEDFPVGSGITNAYGRTKYMIEEILRDFYNSKTLDGATTDWSVTLLRYFNPVGAHPSGAIGEDPNGIPNNLMPFVSQVAIGRREFLTIFGDDYDTEDGTGVRDYLHVVDLAEGHLSALQYMEKHQTGLFVFNLGTGNGYSVLDMCKAMGKACGHEIKYQIGARRPGDIAVCYADPAKASAEMGWTARRGLDEMCRDLWCWQSKNPNGYAGADAKE